MQPIDVGLGCEKCKLCVQDGGLPFARCLKDVHSEFRLLCKLSELLLKEGQHQEALQYATFALQISPSTGNKAFFIKFHHFVFWQSLLCQLPFLFVICNCIVQIISPTFYWKLWTSMVFFVTPLGVRLNERVSYHRLASIYFTLEHYEMAENYYLKTLSLSPTTLEHAEEARYYIKVYCRLADLTLHKIKVDIQSCWDISSVWDWSPFIKMSKNT